MTTTTPASALEGAALLLHLVDRCERGVALAEEYTLLRAGIRQLRAEVLREAVGVAAEEGSYLYDNNWHKASQGAYHVADRLARMAEEGTK